MKTPHVLHIYWSQSLLSVRHVASPKLCREGERASWTGPPRRRGGNMWDGTQHFSREAEVLVLKTATLEKSRCTNKHSGGLVGLQVRRQVGLQRRLAPVPSRTCYTQHGATWGDRAGGWRNTISIPAEYWLAPSPAKWQDFCNWAACCYEKLLAALLKEKIGMKSMGRSPSSFSRKKKSVILPSCNFKTTCSSDWSSSSQLSCKRQECRLHTHTHVLLESRPTAWLTLQWKCFVSFISDMLSEMSEVVLLSYWPLLPFCWDCFFSKSN